MGTTNPSGRDAEPGADEETVDIGTRSAPDPDGTVSVRRPDPAGPAGTLRAPHPGPSHDPYGRSHHPGPGIPRGYAGAPPPYGAPPYGSPAGAPGRMPAGTAPDGRRRTRAVVVVGIVVALLVAGAAVVAVTGLAERVLASGDPPAPAVPAAPATLVGDERTADPCSLLTESSVRRFGRPDTVPERGWPSGCGIELSSDGPGFLSLTAFLTRGDPNYPPQGTAAAAGAGLTVYREPVGSGACRRTVVTPDGTRVIVSAVAREGGRGDLCAVAEAGTASTVAALSAGPLPRRSGAGTPSPLEAVDMCAVADAGVAGRAAGVDTTRRQAGFGDWSCYWGYDPAFRYSPTVDVAFARYARLTGTPTRIAGRAAQVTPSTTAGDTTCSVDLVQRTYTTPDGASRVEVVTVTADAGRQPTTDASCRDARAVAEALVPRLPAA